MSFFYDLNKKLDSIRATPEVTHQQLNERDMSRAAKGYEKYGKQGMEALAKAGRDGKALDPVRKKYDKYDEGQDFGPGPSSNDYQAGPTAVSPDSKNYKTPDSDRYNEYSKDPDIENFRKEKVNSIAGPISRGGLASIGAYSADARGQNKYVDRTTPGVINKIKDKLGLDMPDPAYGPKPDERERLAKRYPAPAKSVDEGGEIIDGVYKLAIEPKRPEEEENKMTRGTRPRTAAPGFGKDDYKPLNPDAMKKGGNSMGTIKGGVFSADPPKPGEKGVPLPKNHERVPEAGAPMTAKQKSFAKLAPPANKITFADKIAGAKKEVDEMLGDVAAEAMRSALGGGRGRNAEMDEERSKGTAFDMSTPRAAKPKVGSVERGAKHDIKHTATGRMVTRRTDDQGISVDSETDDEGNKKEKRTKAGRPENTNKQPERVTANATKHKGGRKVKEGEVDIRDQGEYDQEGDMAKDDIKTIVRHAQALSKVLGDNDNLPEWVQSKLSKIEGMMISIDEYMQNQESDEEEPIAEKAVSKKQQRFMGMVHSAQKGEKPASRAVGKVANTMKPKDTADFAKTKHKGLPEKKKKEVDENSEDGRLTVKQTGPGQTSTSSSTGRISATVDKGTVSVKPAKSGGMSYGKGIYDSFNRDLEQMIAESMSINMSDSTEGNKSLTITATDEDAMKLAMILKSAGLGGGDQHGGDMHGHMVDENAPDYPTNTQTSNDALQYAGGLNKPKTDVAGDGQTTVPNTAVHTQEEDALRRMMEMAGLAEAAKPDFLDINKNGNKEESMKDAADDMNEEEDTVEESIRRMMEIAGVKKKPMDEEKTEEGNLFTKGLEDDNIKIGDKIPGTNAIKKKDIDESIFALTNQWQAYKG
jgi:hypothetical protein